MSTDSLSIPFALIVEGPRYRNKARYGNISWLKDSLLRFGSIQPIVLSRESGGVYNLVAGGRRYRAMYELGVKELHHASTLTPGRLGFVFADEVPEDIRREAEVEENIQHLVPEWQDTCVAIADISELRKRQAGAAGQRWGNRQTAALFGNMDEAKVSYALRIAKLLRSGDKEIHACENMSQAIEVVIRRNESEALARLEKIASQKTPAAVAATLGVSTSSFLDSINISLTKGGGHTVPGNPVPSLGTTTRSAPAIGTSQVQPLAVPQAGPTPSGPPAVVPLSKMFMLGDSVNTIMPALPDTCFDHIVTDIPYGIDMENLSVKGLADVADEHEVDLNVDLMPKFLSQSFRLIRPGGFCVFFYDQDHHEKLQHWAEEAGFKVQRWALIVHKTSRCKNDAAAYNTTKDYEAAMVLRKDSQTVLRKPVPSSVWSGDFAAERSLYNNKFAKPFALWKWIYDMIAFTGQTIYDPFCGEMSGPKAALNCGLVPFGSEISEKHYNRGLQHMKDAYKVIHKDHVEFI